MYMVEWNSARGNPERGAMVDEGRRTVSSLALVIVPALHEHTSRADRVDETESNTHSEKRSANPQLDCMTYQSRSLLRSSSLGSLVRRGASCLTTSDSRRPPLPACLPLLVHISALAHHIPMQSFQLSPDGFPSREDLHYLTSLEVVAVDGSKVKFGSLYESERTLIVFVR